MSTPRAQDGAGVVAVAHRHHRGLTVLMVGTVIGCAFATWWQVRRALDGNVLSYFYEFLWPLYAGYVIYVWLRLRRGANSLLGADPPSAPEPPPEEDDAEVQAYNRYLAGKRADAQRRGR